MAQHSESRADEETQSVAETTSTEDSIDDDQIAALGRTITARSRLSEPELARRLTSIGTTGTMDPNYEVDFEDGNDQANPKNWSLKYKGMAIAMLSYNTLLM
jgi:hypothetical protein